MSRMTECVITRMYNLIYKGKVQQEELMRMVG